MKTMPAPDSDPDPDPAAADLHDVLLAARRRRRPLARSAGAVLLLAIGAFALLGPILIGIDPARQTLSRFLEAPSLAHPLGLDHLGRSMLARLADAARLSLSMALLSVLSAAVPGTALDRKSTRLNSSHWE